MGSRKFRSGRAASLPHWRFRLDHDAPIDGEPVHLTPTEFRLLAALLNNPGKVITNPQLLREVWGPSHSESGHYLRVYMGHLRQKLEDDPTQPKHLLTETAVGYRLVPNPR